MIVFVDQVTERLQYTFDFVFKQHGLRFELTNDLSVFTTSTDSKFSYSDYPFDGIASLEPSSLLFDEVINPHLALTKGEWQGTECLTINGKTDPLAAIFYVISRYEEYITLKRDKHDRFQASDSVLFQFGWLQRQIAEQWVEAIVKHFFPEKLAELKSGRTVTAMPSFDIDNTFAFKWKDGWRKWVSMAKDRFKGNKERDELRRKVLSGEIPDPYDTFDKIRKCAERFDQARVFWLLSDIGEFDRNITWRDPRHQRLIRNIGTVARVGLHPSYASNVSDKRLMEEKQRLAQILSKDVTESRQHFLKLKLPQTYRRLINEGFKKDYTMGFADQPGFRLGTAHPVYFFDLESNQATDYKLIPFVYMDGTFNEYLFYSVEESKTVVKQLLDEVTAYGGIFCFIWHNETIGESGKWQGWSELFDYTLDLLDGSERTLSAAD
ncbi:MAG TPA: polysaccharide deacetylase family protein [Fluviicola sp.]|nr:polysaccharide deacetylase family protein [Fluviicola sp.]